MPDETPQERLEQVLHETPFIQLVQRGRWTFARRTNDVKVVAVVAVTDDNKLLLVEQLRVPVNGKVIELPAGLAGDTGDPNESLETAARRELFEETGYVANTWNAIATVTSSAGLTDEQVTIFRASKLSRESTGGGIEGEQITVYEVPIPELETWLQQQSASGKMIDSRVYAAVVWAARD